MILYFADHLYKVTGIASTNLPDRNGLHIISDRRSEEIGTGFDTYDYTIEYDPHSRSEAEKVLACGNYIFRKSNMDESFTAAVVIESETDPAAGTITISAEDAGLDLLNGLAPAYTPTAVQGIRAYVEEFIKDTGYEIGINEFSDEYIMALAWDDDATITERLLDIAASFEAEIYCSFDIENFWIKRRKVNIVRERGKDLGVQLHEGIHLSNVIVKRDMSGVATALNPIGSSPEGSVGVLAYVDQMTDKPYYTWIKFADTKNGINMNDSGSGNLFMGVAVNQEKMEESPYSNYYKWRRVNYKDTVVTWSTHTTGVQMVSDGGNAKYTWVSFSKNSNGSPMQNSADGMTYIGIATGKSEQTKSTDPADYDWYDMREESSERRFILLSSSTASVKDIEGYTWIKYGTSASGAGISDSASGKTYLGVSLHRSSDTKSSSASDYDWVPITEASVDGGFTVAETVNAGIKISNNNYLWYRFTDLETVGSNPGDGSYIGLRYAQSVATPMSKQLADYDWHETSGDEAHGLTLRGYKYDDGDFYIDGKLLKSREALKNWARDISTATTQFGHIIRTFECDAKTQKDLLKEAIKELKKVRELAVTYDANVLYLPDNVRVGDYVSIVDRDGEIYLKARVLKLETSECSDSRTATFGNYKDISSSVAHTLRMQDSNIRFLNSNTIKSVATYFITTDDGSTPSITDPGWTTDAINQQQGQHVWQMVETTYGDGSKSYSEPTDITVIATAMNVYTLYYKSTILDESTHTYIAPEVPTTADKIPPSEDWSLEEPVYDGNPGELYSVTLTTYSDNSFVYSDVYKVATYSQVSSTIADANEAKTIAEEAKNAAEDATEHADALAETIMARIDTKYGELSASLSELGFTIRNETDPTRTTLNPKGLKIVRKSDEAVIAQFDNDNSYVDYLKVNRHLLFGAHRAEKKSGLEYDNTSIEGTAFFWTGGE